MPSNPVTFAAIYEDHAPAVFRCLLAWSRNYTLSEDLLADTFVRAIMAEQPIQLPTARGYLIAIARNLLLEHLRRPRNVPLHAGSAAAAELHPDPARAIALERTLTAIAGLPDALREPLVLFAIGGLSYDEISRQLKLPIATVKVRIFRARQKLEPYR